MKNNLRFALVMLLALALAGVCFAKAPEEYEDLPQGWSCEAMTAAVENGLMNGVTLTRLDPKGQVTRAQAAAMITRAFGGEGTADLGKFEDLRAGAWYLDEIAAAVRMGVLEGAGNMMMPEQPVTRQQTAVMLARALKLTETNVDLSMYRDIDEIAPWAMDGVCAMLKAGYMQGNGWNINPTDPISREEFAQLLHNIVKTYLGTAGTYTELAAGNVMINTPDVVLKGVHVLGDILIGDGVGDGNCTLDGLTVDGRVLIRGGGENSIHFVGTTVNGTVIVARRDGKVRVVAEDGTEIPVIAVADGSDQVIVSGAVGILAVEDDVEVVLDGATVTEVMALTADTKVKACAGSAVGTVTVSGANAAVEVEKGAAVTTVTSSAVGTAVSGDGTVTEVTAQPGASAVSVTTPNTTLNNNSGSDLTMAGGGVLATGETGRTNADGTMTGNGGSGGGYVPPTYYKLTLTIRKTDDPDKTLTAETSGTTLTGSTPFYTEAISLINDKRGEFKTMFGDAAARAVLDEGLAAYNNNTLAAFYDKYQTDVTGLTAALRSRTVKFSALTGGTVTLVYGAYTVTIAVTEL